MIIPGWSQVLGESSPAAAASRPHGARLPEAGRPGDVRPANLAQQTPPPARPRGRPERIDGLARGSPLPPPPRPPELQVPPGLGGWAGKKGEGRGRGAGRAFKAGSGRGWRSRAAVGARAGVCLFMFRSGPFKCFPRRRSQSLWRLPLLCSSPLALPPLHPLVPPRLAQGPEPGNGTGGHLLFSWPADPEGEHESERGRALVTSRKKTRREAGGQPARRVFAKGRAKQERPLWDFVWFICSRTLYPPPPSL